MPAEQDTVALTLPDGRALNVRLSRRARSRISLSVTPKGEVRLSIPPRVDQQIALQFLHERRDWLMQHLSAPVPAPAAPSALTTIQYLGQSISLNPQPGRRPSAQLQHDILSVYGITDERPVQAIVAKWLHSQAALVLTQRTGVLAGLYGVRPAKVAVSNAGRRWGSCTAQGNIRLNWRLIQAPHEVIDYVITHELAHLRHMNHSSAFWAQVEQWCPDWQQHRNWLKKHCEQLFTLG